MTGKINDKKDVAVLRKPVYLISVRRGDAMSSLTEIASKDSTQFAEAIREFAKGIVFVVIVLVFLAVYGLVCNAIYEATK